MHWRMAHFCLPFWTQTPNADFADHVVAKAWVPMDDTHTMLISIFGGRAKGATYSSLKLKSGSKAFPAPIALDYLPNTTDWFGRWRAAQNPGNDWQIDRDAQRDEPHLFRHSQHRDAGPGGHREHGTDRRSHQGASCAERRDDFAHQAAPADGCPRLREDGTVPPGVDDTEVFWKARAGSFYADDKIDWLDAYQQQLKTAIRWPAPGQQAAE